MQPVPPSRVRLEAIVAPVTFTALALWMLSAGPAARLDVPLDDAWIHQVYVRGLLRDGAPTYNPGVAEAGFSSALWLFAAVPMHLAARAGVLSYALGAKLTSAFFAAAAAERLAKLSRVLGGGTLAALACVALTALSPGLCLGAFSGMEATLALACASAALVAACEGALAKTGLFLALAVLARPESAVLVLLGVSLTNRSPLALAKVLAPPALAAGLWGLYCRAVTGHPLPNTFYVKAQGISLRENAGVFLRDVVLGDTPPFAPLAFVLALLGLGLAWRRVGARLEREPIEDEGSRSSRARRVALLRVALAPALAVAAVFASRPLFAGVTFFQLRYFLPFAPLGLPFAALAIEAMFARVTVRPLRGVLAAALVTAGLFSVAPCRVLSAASSAEIFELHTRPALELAANARSTEPIAAEAAGATAFFSGHRVVDLYGLNLARFAHAQSASERGCILAREDPAWVLVPEHFVPSVERPFALALVRTYTVPRSVVIRSAGPRRVLLFRARVRPALRARCLGASQAGS